MDATNSGYAGVRMTSGTKVGESGNRVNFPVLASTAPRRLYPSWSLHEMFQSPLWYQMKNRPWSAATRHTIHKARRPGMAGILVQQFPVQRFDVVDESVERVSRGDRLTAAPAHLPSPRGIEEQRDREVGQGGRVVERR